MSQSWFKRLDTFIAAYLCPSTKSPSYRPLPLISYGTGRSPPCSAKFCHVQKAKKEKRTLHIFLKFLRSLETEILTYSSFADFSLTNSELVTVALNGFSHTQALARYKVSCVRIERGAFYVMLVLHCVAQKAGLHMLCVLVPCWHVWDSTFHATPP